MSEIVNAVVPEVKDAPEHAVDKVEEHTPAVETSPVVEKLPDPPVPQDAGLDELKDIVAKLGTTVATLTDLVTDQLPKDASPHSVPWTHRGSHRSESD